MFSWLLKLLRHDRSCVDYTHLNARGLPIDPNVTQERLRNARPGTAVEVTDFDTMMVRRGLDNTSIEHLHDTNLSTYTSMRDFPDLWDEIKELGHPQKRK